MTEMFLFVLDVFETSASVSFLSVFSVDRSKLRREDLENTCGTEFSPCGGSLFECKITKVCAPWPLS